MRRCIKPTEPATLSHDLLHRTVNQALCVRVMYVASVPWLQPQELLSKISERSRACRAQPFDHIQRRPLHNNQRSNNQQKKSCERLVKSIGHGPHPAPSRPPPVLSAPAASPATVSPYPAAPPRDLRSPTHRSARSCAKVHTENQPENSAANARRFSDETVTECAPLLAQAFDACRISGYHCNKLRHPWVHRGVRAVSMRQE